MTSRYAHLLAMVALVVLMASGPAFAQTDYDTDNDNLIDVTSLAQLNAIRWDLNGDGAIDASASTSDTTAYNAAFPNAMSGMGCAATCTGYELMNNLNFDENSDNEITSADATYWNNGAGWAPIGNSETKYTGNFHGNDNTISNLFIDRSAANDIGLFGFAEGGTIRNLSLVNADVTGSSYTAVLVGQGTRLQLMHIRVTGQVSGLSNGGGLVGSLTHGSSTITACGAEVDVTGRGSRTYSDISFGGLVGGNSGTITASYATGAVSNDNVYVGGLVGFHGSSAVIRASYATGAVRGQTLFGGLVGIAFGGAITASYATGAVKGTGAVSYIGGLVGFNSSTSITYSYYDSTTTGQKDTGRGAPQTTAGLQNPTDYTGIYANWNLNLDGQTGNDNPWSFGTTSQYPVLKYAGMDTAAQFNAQRVGKPTGVMVAGKTDTLTVTWGLVRNATGYKVRWKSGILTYPTSDLAAATRGQATIGSVLTTTYDISGLTTGTTYTVQVIATRLNATDSDPSDAVMVTPATTKPTNVRVTPAPVQLIVDWTKATGATGYKVQWKSGGQTYNTSSRQAMVSGVNTTTYTIEGLTFGTTYTVRVTATLAGGTDSDPSDEVVGTPLRGLDMPTGVIVMPKVDTLDVRWTAVSTATGYKVQWKLHRRTYDVSRQVVVTGTRYAIPNLIAGASYLVRIIATKAGLPESAPSTEVPGVPLLRSPMGVMVTADMDTLTVTWNAVDNATGYKVQWKSGNLTYPTADVETTALRGQATIAGGNTTTHKISGLTAGTTYTIRVIATHTNVADSAPSVEVPGVPLLGKPTVMVAAKMDTLTVTWNAVDDATGYKVQWKSGNLTYPTADLDSATRGQATIAGGNTTTHKISGVTVGTLYAVRVIATSTNTNIADSTPSEEVMVMPATNRPTNVRVTPGTTQLLVRWTEATGATGYKVQWKSGQQAYDPSSRQAQVSGVSTTTYTIENLTVSTTYTVRVIAILSGGVDSTPSDEVMGTPPGIDYDRDGDGLIDITTLAQLNAIRYDMDGNGDATHAVYAAAFPNRDTTSSIRMGCPSGTCTGYELLNNLDFSGGQWTSGAGWLPIGVWGRNSWETYTGTFKGNNKTISNLYINRGDDIDVGLFGHVSGNISGLGLKNVDVRGTDNVGGLVGEQEGGRILSCFVTGRVEGWSTAIRTTGGLVGRSGANTVIAASYANAEVIMDLDETNAYAGGLVGFKSNSSEIIASYAIGPVTGRNAGGLIGHGGAATSFSLASYSTGTVTGGGYIGGFVGRLGAGSYSYWDTESSDLLSSAGGTGQTTSALQSETDYDGIYASWDVDVDGRVGNDDPWTFGAADQYPVLKYAGMDTTAQFAMQPPGIPTSVTVTVQAATLDVRWRAASYATGYKVQWKSGMQSYDASREGIVTGTRYNIPNLAVGTTYTVRVIATKTGARDGRPSAEQTGVISVLGSPTVMVAAKLDTLTVTWNVVTSATGYKVQWKSGSETYPNADLASALRGQATIVGGSTTTYKIPNVTRGTAYTVRVIATRTNVADSAPSEEVTGVPGLERPTGVDVSATVDTLTVTWNVVDDATGYKVQWKSGSETYPNADLVSALRGQATLVGGSTTTYKIPNVTTGTTYTVRVIATRTNVADSAPSEEVTVLVSPTGVMVRATVDTLTVTWNAVDDATGYKVQWKSGSETYPNADSQAATHGQATISDGGTTTYDISGLTAGTTYTVRIIATSTNSNVADSAPSAEQTGVPVLGSPAVMVAAKADTLTVMWNAVDDATGYKVQWKSGSETYPNADLALATHGQATIAGGGTTTYKISGLTAGTTYTIRVIATRTNVADSAPSAEQTGVPVLGSPAVMVRAKLDTLTVTWNVVTNATGYKVQWKSGSEIYPTSDEQSATRGQATIVGGRTTTYKISGLTRGTTYTVRVIATRTNVADSAPSAEQTGVPVLGSPAVMVAAKVDTLTVTWNAVDDATGYKVQWKSGSEIYPTSDEQSATRGQATIAGGSTTTYKISNVTTGTAYTVRVIATRTNVADSAPSEEVTVLVSPTGVMVAAKVDTLTVTWNAVDDATGYKVQWKSGAATYPNTDSQAATHGQATISDGGTTTYDISGLTAGTTYTVRIIATSTNSNVADSAPSAEQTGVPVLGSPAVMVAAKVDTLTVTWNVVDDATGYKVQWKSGSATYPTADLALATRGQATIAGGGTTTYKISGLTTGTTYTIRVIATRTNVADSAPSDEVMVTLATNKPTNVNVRVTPGIAQLIVRWTEATGATGYKVQWKSGGQSYNTSSRQETVSGGSTTTYTIENLTFGTPYTVRVTATLTGGMDSTPSDEVVGTPQAINYDSDGDGLIAIETLAQLHAIRWDLNGDGAVDASATSSDTTAYNAAFPGRDTTSNVRMGCPSGTCTGYELLNNLNFDTDGSGSVTSDDTYPNWVPIGNYSATFKGNNKTISNLHINRGGWYHVGLFSQVGGNISGLGLKSVNVRGGHQVGGLVGNQWGGRILGCYVTGRVEGTGSYVGGLVGHSTGNNTVIAVSYTNAVVSGGRLQEGVGGLVGILYTTVIASYAIGPVTGNSRVGGLVGRLAITSGHSPLVGSVSTSYATGTVTRLNQFSSNLGGLIGSKRHNLVSHSYWDRESSGFSTSAGGTGKTTSELQSQTSYNDIYASWNVNVDGSPGNDNPWTFGAADQYPVLKYAGMDTTAQFAMQAPGIPTSVTVTVQADTLDVRWRAASYATGYKVQWKAGGQNYAVSRQAITTDTRYKIANLLAGTTYTVRVIATKTGARDGRPSAEQTGVPVLGSPTVMVAAKADTLTVTWNAVTNATGYKVQWKSGAETYPAADEESATHGQATIAGGRTTTYDISGLTAGTAYAIRVIATRTNVADSAPSAEQTGVPVLDSPTGVDVSATVDTLTVTWNVVDDATGYKVQWKSGSETYPNADSQSATRGQATISGGGTTTHKISGLTTGTTYTVQVIATHTTTAGNSAPSAAVMVTSATTKPTNVRVTPGPLRFIVAWTEATGATGYKVQWKSGGQSYNTATRQVVVSMNTRTATIVNLTIGTIYTVRVTATLAGGIDSDPSDEVMVTIQGINYDSDGDGLIAIETLAQLHAIRWDLNGDGAIDASASTSDTTAYNAAFPNRDTTSNVRMGCPSGTCTGYELLNNLDFDENGDDEITSADATYWNNGDGWLPIGTDAAKYTGDFKGNGYTIDNLTINRPSVGEVGLFGNADTASRIESVGITNASVAGGEYAGALVGALRGIVVACYSTGNVSATTRVAGGLVGWTPNAITSSYSTASVSGPEHVGGLLGSSQGGSVTNSYSTGTVTGTGSSPLIGGLIGSGTGGTASYWDTQTSGCTSGGSNGCTTSAGGGGVTGQTTSALQSPTGYTLIFSTWNANLDGQAGNDDPWAFGKTDQYPVLKYAGMDTTVQYNLQPPGIPTSVTVTPQRDTLDVRWTAASYATGYKVQWKSGMQSYDTSRQGTVTGTRYKISNLIGGTTYTVRVIATKTGAPDGTPSAEQTGVSVLGSPTVMVAAKVDTLTVTWNAVSNATGYKVQWKSGSETYPAADEESATHGQATIADGRATTYDISGLTAGMAYTVRVIATSTNSNVADSAPSAEQTGVPLLGSPTVMVAATVDTLTVTWNVVDDATGYKVQWKSGSETYPNADLAAATHGQATIAGGGTTTYDISGLTAGTTYAIRVIATRTNVADSAPSDAVMVTLATNKPTNVRVTPGPVQLIVRWSEATGATGYKVQWKSGVQSYNTTTRQVVVSMNTRTATIVNLTFGTPYTVRVLATLSGGGDSEPSDEVMGTPQGIDYDSDGDGLINIETLAQLHAIRWDLNGDGIVADSDAANYNAAFPSRDTTSNVRMGCPSGTCTGYELITNLNFDQNNDGEITSADATYWNANAGWQPIGTYTGTFKGNNKTISNLYINRGGQNDVGLFVDLTGTVSGLGLRNVDVRGNLAVGGLTGNQAGGAITGCYVTGRVRGSGSFGLGGLVGHSHTGANRRISASYSAAAVTAVGSGANFWVGGLVGWQNGGTIIASYATGAVTVTGNGTKGGLVGRLESSGEVTASYATGQVTGDGTKGGLVGSTAGTVTNSYWDSDRSGIAGGKSTSDLQSQTTYGATSNDTYYDWNLNVDGDTSTGDAVGKDDPWTFGATDQYPVLKYAGMDTTAQFKLQPSVVMLTLMPSTISENSGVSTVTATLVHPSISATTITVRPVAGAYTVGSDSTITIAAESTTNASDTVVITAVDNTRDEPARDVPVSGVARNAQGAGRVIEATLTLTDDDSAPTATLAASPLSISENLGVSTITATLSRPSSSATTITVRPVADAYTVGTDSTITIAAGDTTNASDTVAITAVDNAQDALDRNATVSGVSRNAHGAGSVTGVTLTLTDDDDAPDVTMVVTPASISENGAISTVTATLSHTSSDPTTITVSVPTSSDYTLSTADTLIVAAGQTMSAGTVTITTVDNSISSGNKTVTVSSTVGNSVGTGSVTVATLTISDDEVAQVTLVLSPASIAETGAVSTVTATLDRAATAATTITVSAEAVPPAVANDFTLSTTTTLTIAAGVTTSTGAVTITSVNDTTDAPDKGVTVSATVAGGDGASLSSAVTLTITDDEAAPTVTLSLSPASISEASGVSTITATLSHRSSAAMTITVRPVADAYTVGSDSTITIAAGSTANASDTVVITAVNNTQDEPDRNETVSVVARNAHSTGSVTEATLTLEDDDAAPDVMLALSPASISEDGGVSTVTATLTHPSSEATTITVRPVADAYTVGMDSTIAIAAGDTTNAADTVALTAVDNDIDAADNAAMVQAAVENDHGEGNVQAVTLTITDDDEAAIEVSAVTSTIVRLRTTEAGRAATFTVTLATEPTGDVALSVVSSNTDEGTVSPSVLTFTPSDWNTAQTVTVTGQDDAPANSVDGNQNYTVTLSVNQTDTQDDNYDALSNISVYMVNLDNDFGLDISAVTGQATEAGASATFTVALLTQPTAAVTISVTSQDPSEGRVEPAVLTFTTSGWNTAQTVTVTGQDDTIDDGDIPWTVRLALSSDDTGYNTLADDVQVTTTDDEDAPTVTLVLMPSSISENAEVSTVSATLSHPSSAITTITVSATPVSPATADDFTLSNADTLIIAATATTSTGTVTITSVNDTTDAPAKRVTVSGVANNDQGAGSVTDETLVLTDDDEAPTVTLVLSPSSILENGGVSTITATLSHASSAAMTITVRPVAGAYTVGSDSTIIIAAGSTANATDTVVITAVNNTQDAPDRSETVSVVARNAHSTGSVTEATLTLEDDDAAPDVTLALSPASISEAGGVSTVSATLTHPSSEATTITVRPVADAYTVGSDSTITIAAGDTTNATDTVALTAVDNDIDASDNAAMVQAAVENDHGEGNVQAATLTITDDDEAAIEVSPMTSTIVRLETTEAGRAETFTVTLATEPTGDVALSVVSSNTDEGTVSPSVLTFMPSDWNTAQTVTVTGQDDAPTNSVDGNQNYTVTLSVNQTDTQDANYDALSNISVYMVNLDNDSGLDISAVTGQATEAGGSATFTVALLSQPSAAVTVSVTSQDPSEGRVEPAVLTFTTSGWNTAQTVTVTGQDDTIDDGDIPWTVRLALSSDDTGYNTLADDVQVTTTDDEDAPTVTLVLMPSSISENGEVSTITATLSHPSSAITTITVSATPVSPATASDFTLSSADTLIIAVTTTTSTGTVTITAEDNNDQADEKTVTVSATANNAQGITAPSDVTLTITDDETPSANLDVDGNGEVRLFSDIILIIRYVLFFREEALVRGNVIEPDATRKTPQTITPYLDTLVGQNILDVDGDGDVR